MLTSYITTTRLYIHDQAAQAISDANLTIFINEARNRVSGMGKCVRVLVAGSGPITSIAVTAGGTNYSSQTTVFVSGGQGSGCVAIPTITLGVITAITLTSGGNNYSPPLVVTVNDPTGLGTGATATAAQAEVLNLTVSGQEVYKFSAVNTIAQQTSGVASILGVQSVAVYWGSWKPVLNRTTWTRFQASFRAWSYSTGQPSVFANYGRGLNGSIYIYPIPSGSFGMDWDCYCLPVALVDDTTFEAIPGMWTDAVPYYAAYLYYLNAQRQTDADKWLKDYTRIMMENGAFADTPFVPTYYPGN